MVVHQLPGAALPLKHVCGCDAPLAVTRLRQLNTRHKGLAASGGQAGGGWMQWWAPFSVGGQASGRLGCSCGSQVAEGACLLPDARWQAAGQASTQAHGGVSASACACAHQPVGGKDADVVHADAHAPRSQDQLPALHHLQRSGQRHKSVNAVQRCALHLDGSRSGTSRAELRQLLHNTTAAAAATHRLPPSDASRQRVYALHMLPLAPDLGHCRKAAALHTKEGGGGPLGRQRRREGLLGRHQRGGLLGRVRRSPQTELAGMGQGRGAHPQVMRARPPPTWKAV